MINNNYKNHPSFGLKVVYYNNSKNVPGYVQKVINSLKSRTTDISDSFEFTYNGHRRYSHTFTLRNSKENKSITSTFDRDVDFLDHKSFKYLKRDERETKIAQRAMDLKQIVLAMKEKMNNI